MPAFGASAPSKIKVSGFAVPWWIVIQLSLAAAAAAAAVQQLPLLPVTCMD